MSQERTRFPIQPQDVRRSGRSSRVIRTSPAQIGKERARMRGEWRQRLLEAFRKRRR